MDKLKIAERFKYMPSHLCFAEKRDISSLISIEKWASQLRKDFETMIKPLLGTKQVYGEPLEVFGNQLTLLLLFTGQHELCVKYCRTIIRRYYREYVSTGDFVFLEKMVQPSINLTRFHRLNSDMRAFWSAFKDLDYHRGESVFLNGHEVAKANFRPEINNLLKSVAISERIKAYLKTGEYNLILEMDDWLPDGPRPLFFIEAKIIAYIMLGEQDSACSLILSIMKKVQGITQLIFYFRLADLARRSGELTEADAICHQIMTKTDMFRDDAIFFSHVAMQMSEPRKSDIDFIIAELKAKDDEHNIGMIMLNAMRKGYLEYKDPLITLAGTTGYASLREKCRRQLGLVDSTFNIDCFSELNEYFNQVFQLEHFS